MNIEYILTGQRFATLFLVGLIWFVQIVHYPLFNAIKDSPSYYLKHQYRTTCVVIPVMFLEMGCALALFFFRHFYFIDQIGLYLLMVVWLSTLFLQVPCHLQLRNTYSPLIVNRLVNTNWIRTIAWSARGAIVLFF
tara:strand:+ start:7866 stop:8273 length:408 start_codon:yes stop_codon:yes gene_type:complete